MRAKFNMWIVVAFVLATAATSFAQDRTIEVPANWDGQQTTVRVDPEFYNNPGTSDADRILEKVAASNRQGIAELRGDMDYLDGRVNGVEIEQRRQAQSGYGGGDTRQTVLEPRVVIIREPPPGWMLDDRGGEAARQEGDPSANRRTYDRRNRETPAREPERRSPMSVLEILGLVGGIVLIVVGAIIALTWAPRAVTNINENNAAVMKEQRAEERRIRSANMVQDAITGIRETVGSDDPTRFPAGKVDGVVRGADGVVARISQERTSADWLTMANARVNGTGGGAGGGTPRATNQQIAAAVLSLSTAVPGPLASTGTNLDNLVAELVRRGIDGSNAAAVDNVREALRTLGDIT